MHHSHMNSDNHHNTICCSQCGSTFVLFPSSRCNEYILLIYFTPEESILITNSTWISKWTNFLNGFFPLIVSLLVVCHGYEQQKCDCCLLHEVSQLFVAWAFIQTWDVCITLKMIRNPEHFDLFCRSSEATAALDFPRIRPVMNFVWVPPVKTIWDPFWPTVMAKELISEVPGGKKTTTTYSEWRTLIVSLIVV